MKVTKIEFGDDGEVDANVKTTLKVRQTASADDVTKFIQEVRKQVSQATTPQPTWRPSACTLDKCPPYGTRCSPCSQLATEDNRTPITEGLRVYNYYDGEWGTVSDIRDDGWFTHTTDDGARTSLNGARCSTKEV